MNLNHSRLMECDRWHRYDEEDSSMLTVRVRWTLLLVIAFFGLAPSQQAEGGEFLKRLFGRKCRATWVRPAECMQSPAVASTGEVTNHLLLKLPKVCPLSVELEVLDGQDNCVFAVYRAVDCDTTTYMAIPLPCKVPVGACDGQKKCKYMDIDVSRSVAPTKILGLESRFEFELGLGIDLKDVNDINFKRYGTAKEENDYIGNVSIDGVNRVIYFIDVTISDGKTLGVGFEIAPTGTANNRTFTQILGEGTSKGKLLKDNVSNRYYFVTLAK